jgi:hypothetical protein
MRVHGIRRGVLEWFQYMSHSDMRNNKTKNAACEVHKTFITMIKITGCV